MRPNGGSFLGVGSPRKSGNRAASDGSFLLPAHPSRQAALDVGWTPTWQEWRDSNPQPPVLETGALTN
jgi:hypothetical protein